MTIVLQGRRTRRVLGYLSYAAAALAIALLAAGFFGSSLQLFDTFAHFRGHLVAVLLVLAIVLSMLRAFAAGAVCLIVAAGGFYAVLPFLPPLVHDVAAGRNAAPAGAAAPARYTLLQMNLRWNASRKAEAIRTIGRISPDIITLEEASVDWQPLLETLADRYPYRFGCSDDRYLTDALILSRRPFAEDTDGICGGGQRFAARTIDLNGTRLVVGAQHLRWPWPGSQWRQIGFTADALKMLTLTGVPVLIAGDFNAAPWSAAVRTYAELSGTRVVEGIGPTWFFQPLTALVAPLAGLPIDNVLASDGVRVLSAERLTATSSDHLPVLVTFSLPSATAPLEPSTTVAYGSEASAAVAGR